MEDLINDILQGDRIAAMDKTLKALDSGIDIEEILMKGIVKAWTDYEQWYQRDQNDALKKWFDCFTATNRILKVLETKIKPISNPPFSVLVITVKGEGHVLIKDVIAILLKAKGLKVYEMKKGVIIEDISNYLSDPSLKFVVISCTQDETRKTVVDLLESVKKIRSDLKIVLGGPIAEDLSADIVISDPSKLFNTLISF